MKILNEKGFGAVETILILVIVGIIGSVGWFVYNSQKKTNESLDNASQNIETIANTKQEDKNTDDKKAESSQKYLEIKELGIKLPLSADILDAHYDKTTRTDQFKESVNVRVSSLDTSIKCKNDQNSLGGIFKSPKDTIETVSGKKFSEVYTGVIKGDHYYYYVPPNYNCDESRADQVRNVINAFKESAKTIQTL